MSAFSMRLFAAAIALGVTEASTASRRPLPPRRHREAKARRAGLAPMPNGKVAAPPQVTAPQVSTSCPAAQYGAKSAAPGSGKTVALTFDDGPGASTAGILSILGSYGIRRRFNIGQNMAARPTLVRQEASMGYVLDNHTWDHPNMTTLPPLAQGTEMDQATAEAGEPDRVQPCGFRPPGGNYNSTTLSQAQQRRMTVWTWLVDDEDEGERLIVLVLGEPDHQPGREGRLSGAPGGADAQPAAGTRRATVLALRTIIQYFGSHGYTFVDLLGRTAARTPGNLGDEINPSGNGFDVFHRQQAGERDHRRCHEGRPCDPLHPGSPGRSRVRTGSSTRRTALQPAVRGRPRL